MATYQVEGCHNMSIQQMLIGVGAVDTKTYVDDVFSTYLYRGTGSANHSILNGIDLAGEGGLVWTKNRDDAFYSHSLFDTERGVGQILKSNASGSQSLESNTLTTFLNNGFKLNGDNIANESGDDFSSWTFRKAPGFLDIVEWSGNGANRLINHNLGSVPGMVAVKCKSHSQNWHIWHKAFGYTHSFAFNRDAMPDTGASSTWNSTNPTATQISVGPSVVNASGRDYVAYVFAHNEQSFGEDGNSSVIHCGSYTGNGSESNGTEVNIGWEPQWLMVKRANGSGNWGILDTMRGWVADGQGDVLFPNRQNVEDNGANSALPTSTGFKLHTTNNEWNGNNDTYMYVAIRRPDGYVGKPPSLGTDAFAMAVANGSTPSFISNFPVDWALMRLPDTANNWSSSGRLAPPDLQPDNANEEDTSMSSIFKFDHNNGWAVNRSSPRQSWMWKRHAGFDVVCYDGTGSAKNINHSLNKVAEMMWVKVRSRTGKWTVYHKDMGQGYGSGSASNFYMYLNETDARVAGDNNRWDNTAPTSSVFTVGTADDTNRSGHTLVAMLFASTDVSKVGSYSGSGGVLTITTGFQPRFIMVKKTNGAGGWHVFDTTRGMGSGNDPLLYLNSNGAQITVDYVTPSSTGWSTTSGNLSEGDYIYYAHA